MISRVSLFNKGIYKSTVRRNLWGSALYFIFLFLITSMPLISQINSEYIAHRISNGYSVPIIYQEQYLLVPLFMAIVVPTIVAMLLYRFIHSKRTAVFVHGLPVGRTANYISTLAAGFILMAMPVVLNGMVLIALSLTVYSKLFTVYNCLVWIGLNVVCQFVLFSVSTLAAMITGNTIATAGLNLLLHTFTMIIVGCFGFVAENFLYGYVADNQLLTKVMDANPAVWITSIASLIGHNNYSSILSVQADVAKTPYFVIAAVVVYVISWFLYKKRGMETAEDVAAFRVLNPIYKYFVTFIGTMTVYAVFNHFFRENRFAFFAIVAILGAVIYFAVEMILKKSFRVWQSYKGYVCFAGAFAVMICTFAFTSFFGYETRVPDVEDIEKVAVYNYYYRDTEPYVDNSEVIRYAVEKHSEIVTHQNIIEHNNDLGHYDTRIHFKYLLKNGKTLTRAYRTKDGTAREIMTGLYKIDDYVVANEGVFREDKLLRVVFNTENIKVNISDTDKVNEFVQCVKQDLLNLEYNQIHIGYNCWGAAFEVQYEMTREVNDGPTSTVTSIDAYDGLVLPESSYILSEHHQINSNYENTINWLKQNGYWDELKPVISTPVHIVDISGVAAEDMMGKGLYEYINSGTEIAYFDSEDDLNAIAEFVGSIPVSDEPNMEYDYVICCEEYSEAYAHGIEQKTIDIGKKIIAQTDKQNIDNLFAILAAGTAN